MSLHKCGASVNSARVGLKALEKTEFVIEAVPENEQLKRNIFSQLSKVRPLTHQLRSPAATGCLCVADSLNFDAAW